MFVASIDRSELPKGLEYAEEYDQFYVVKNFDVDGVIFMHIGYHKKERQYVVWYRGGKFWSSYGTSLKSAIEGAQKDGWMYTA